MNITSHHSHYSHHSFFIHLFFSFFMLFLGLFLQAVPLAGAFSDSDNSKTEALKLLETKEIFDTKTDDIPFLSHEVVRRGEFLKWTLRNAGFSEKNFTEGQEPFIDIRKNQDIFPFVASAYASGAIVDFEKSKKFMPEKTLSRVEALNIIFLVEGISTFQKYPRTYSAYRDLPKDTKDRAIIITALKKGLITANKKNSLFPYRKITKGDLVEILAKVSQEKNTSPSLKISTSSSALKTAEEIILKESLQKQTLTHTGLEEKALNGMLDSLDDPYSVYMPPKESKNFNNFIKGKGGDIPPEYAGIGVAVLKKKKGGLIITQIFDGPAKKANLHVGDEIIKVNGEDIETLRTKEITDKIKGVIGTFVSLTIKRTSEHKNTAETVFTKKITRGKIDISDYRNVETSTKENLVWMRIHAFQTQTASDFKKSLEKNITDDTKGIIIDLRYNPGGLLGSAKKMLGEVLPPQTVAVKLKNGDNKETSIPVSGSADFTDIPLVVIQNESSASASEIFAGAIQDNKRGKIIGKKSFGKGVAQNLYSLSNGGQIKLTTNEFFTPLGKKVHHTGITPDIKVDQGDDKTLWNIVKKILK